MGQKPKKGRAGAKKGGKAREKIHRRSIREKNIDVKEATSSTRKKIGEGTGCTFTRDGHWGKRLLSNFHSFRGNRHAAERKVEPFMPGNVYGTEGAGSQ